MDVELQAGSFRLRRVGLLLRRDLVQGYRSTLIAMASVAGVVLIISLSIAWTPPGPSRFLHTTLFSILLVAGGLVSTSVAFRELHADAASVLYLTLPGTSLEKFVSKAAVTSVGYGLGVLLFYTALAALSEGINWLILRNTNTLFNPVDPAVLRGVAMYAVLQTIFLTGSVYFRKLAFLKTLGMLSLIAAVVVAVGLVVIRIVLRDHLFVARAGSGWSIRPATAIGRVLGGWSSGEIPLTPGLDAFVKLVRVLFWAAVAPVAWLVAYLRMREKEV
jgi:hypothetical protein